MIVVEGKVQGSTNYISKVIELSVVAEVSGGTLSNVLVSIIVNTPVSSLSLDLNLNFNSAADVSILIAAELRLVGALTGVV